MRRLHFSAGDIIIKEDTIGQAAYILKTGRVNIVKRGKNRDVILATLDPEQIFGELGLIEDRPRTASVLAATDVEVTEIVRDDFQQIIGDPDTPLIPIIKGLFERLRQCNELIVRLETEHDDDYSETDSPTAQIQIAGLSPEARAVLGNKKLTLSSFPYKIGRASKHVHKDVLIDNDLYIPDVHPYNISRNHVSINQEGQHYFVVDRGSSMGTIVNHTQLGSKGKIFRIALQSGENTLILGQDSSPFRFSVTI